MEDIKENEYVRTKEGFILKKNRNTIIYEDDVKKHSLNLIDLVEVGDYVNGEIVKSIPLSKCVEGIKKGFWRIAECENEDIKTIVTKEQYEANSYKVKESK